MLRIAIITGGAVGVWQQRDLAVELVAAAGHRAVYIACNDSGVEHPDPLHHWASLHANQFEIEPYRWEQKRAGLGRGRSYTLWGQSPSRHVERVSRDWSGGSSGLLALSVALNGVRCAGAILCGVPLDERLNVFKGKQWSAAHRYRYSWTKRVREFGHCTRSLSGWTAQLLGLPSVDWLRSLGPR